MSAKISFGQPHHTQLPFPVVRALLQLFQQTQPGQISLPWGARLHIDPREIDNSSIWRTGSYNLAATEAIWRLLGEGHTAVDVGAHIGYITTLMQARVGTTGTVHAFEPNPAVRPSLERNVRSAPGAEVVLHDAILEPHCLPVPARANTDPSVAATGDGAEAQLLGSSGNDRSDARSGTTLDDVFPSDTVDLVRVSGDGQERVALQGARHLLDEGRLRAIIYEDRNGFTGETGRLLRESGYAVRQLSLQTHGLGLLHEGEGPVVTLEPPTFIGSKDMRRVAAAFCAPDWIPF